MVENSIMNLSNEGRYRYYLTTAQTETDLVLEGSDQQIGGIKIKHSSAPTLSSGSHTACDDRKTARKFVV